jgi:hypothetical protein
MEKLPLLVHGKPITDYNGEDNVGLEQRLPFIRRNRLAGVATPWTDDVTHLSIRIAKVPCLRPQILDPHPPTMASLHAIAPQWPGIPDELLVARQVLLLIPPATLKYRLRQYATCPSLRLCSFRSAVQRPFISKSFKGLEALAAKAARGRVCRNPQEHLRQYQSLVGNEQEDIVSTWRGICSS